MISSLVGAFPSIFWALPLELIGAEVRNHHPCNLWSWAPPVTQGCKILNRCGIGANSRVLVMTKHGSWFCICIPFSIIYSSNLKTRASKFEQLTTGFFHKYCRPWLITTYNFRHPRKYAFVEQIQENRGEFPNRRCCCQW